MTTTPSKPIEQVQREAMEFLRNEAGFAQVYTISRDGFPVGRTMGAPINDDWTVDLIQGRSSYARVDQARRNPNMEILWIDTSTRVPRAVFLRGTGQIFDGQELVDKYNRRMDINEARGRSRGPRRSPDEVLESLIGIHVTPIRIRVEGFGDGAEVFIWTP